LPALTFKHTTGEKIMEKNKVLKAIISASAAAIMFSALPASAQSATSAMGSNKAGMTGTQQTGMSGAAGATASSAALSAADKKAIMDMGMANMAEVETGKLAVAKSQSADVKAFAQQMIDDHGKALTEVQALASAKGVTLPTELDAKHKAMAAKLEKLSGDKFDKEYMKNAGVADHKTVHAKLTKDEKAAKDADVKALAGKMKPTVEQHLKSAEMITAKK
jgi:putative membrane protein